MDVNPRLLHPTVAFLDETEHEALGRYSGFGATVFDVLWERVPELRSSFYFFRDPSTDDVWSYCRSSYCEFGLQLDSDIQVICLWDSSDAVEIGIWVDAAVADAVQWVVDRHMTK